MNSKKPKPTPKDCKVTLLAIRDTMQLLSGKWKVQIIGSLLLHEKMRFMDMLRDVEGIAAKMLSKELQELEQNNLVKRTVLNTKPVTVEYNLTPHGKTLKRVINEIAQWGVAHRKVLIGKEDKLSLIA